jgi:hypothetical protein
MGTGGGCCLSSLSLIASKKEMPFFMQENNKMPVLHALVKQIYR